MQDPDDIVVQLIEEYMGTDQLLRFIREELDLDVQFLQHGCELGPPFVGEYVVRLALLYKNALGLIETFASGSAMEMIPSPEFVVERAAACELSALRAAASYGYQVKRGLKNPGDQIITVHRDGS